MATPVAAKNMAANVAADLPPQWTLPAQDPPATVPGQQANPLSAEPAAAVLPTPTEPTKQADRHDATRVLDGADARRFTHRAARAGIGADRSHADGAQRLTVRLDPPELGQVQVRIERPRTPARVDITVEHAET